MRKAADLLLGQHDFSNFTVSEKSLQKNNTATTVKTLKEILVEKVFGEEDDRLSK